MTTPDLSFLDGDAAAAGVLADLAAQRWRKARDATKVLCKKDRDRYLPLLVAANAGLAHDLLSRGLTKDAGPVIDYLKTIAPPAFVSELEAVQSLNAVETMLQRGAPERAAVISWELVCAAASTLERGGVPSAAAVQAADQFVSGTLTPPSAVTGTGPSVMPELALVQAAVEATGDGRWESAQEILRGLPRRSLFQHWRLFLRGVRCAHHGDTAMAQQCFDSLPASSTTARAALPWRKLCGLPATPDKAPLDATAALLLAMCGAPAEWAAPLAAADSHWRKRRPAAAFDALRNGPGEQFPDDKPGLPGLLTDLVLGGKLNTTGITREHIGDYFDHLYELVRHHRCRSEREQKIIRRTLCLNDGNSMEPGALEQHFAEIVRIDRKLHGADPLRESAAWAFAAELAMGGFAVHGLSVRDGTPREIGIIRIMHKQAAALDPAHPAPALALLSFYEAAGEASAAGKEASALAKRFPDNKEVLLRSAAAAISRKSWAGALRSLRRARTIDPIDADVRHRLAAALFESAVEMARKKPVPAALWTELEPLLVDGPAHPQSMEHGTDFTSFRWVVQAGRALLEHDPAGPGPAPSVLVGHFLTVVLAVRWRRVSDITGMVNRVIAAAPSATWMDFEWIIRAAAWNESTKPCTPLHLGHLRRCMDAVSQPLLQSARITTDPQGALNCALAMEVCTAPDQHDGIYHLASKLAQNMARALDKHGNRSGADYRLRLASIALPFRSPPRGHSCYCPVLEELEKTASAAGDARSAAAARRLIVQCGTRSPGPGIDLRRLFGIGDEDDDWDDADPMPLPAGRRKRRGPGMPLPDLFSELFR